jgi:uncharacterized protein (DUF1330 family)
VSVYVITQLRFTDRAAYDRYQAEFADVFRRYSGMLLAADAVVVLAKGLA